MSLRIDLDTTQYDVKMNIFRSELPPFPEKAVRSATGIIEENLIPVIPVKTGTLKGSVRKSVIGKTGKVETTAGYGLYVDEDTKAHKITGNPLLAFQWRGKLFIRHSVNHPGTKGQQFRRQALDNSRIPILNEITRIYNTELAK